MATQPFGEERVAAIATTLRRLRASGSLVAVDSEHGIRRLLQLRDDEPIDLIESACQAAKVDFRYDEIENRIILSFSQKSPVA